jgi:hypothetical protein
MLRRFTKSTIKRQDAKPAQELSPVKARLVAFVDSAAGDDLPPAAQVFLPVMRAKLLGATEEQTQAFLRWLLNSIRDILGEPITPERVAEIGREEISRRTSTEAAA